MSCALPFPDDLLTVDEHAALVDAAEELWEARAEIVAQWSEGLSAAALHEFLSGGPLADGNRMPALESMLSVMLDSARVGDFRGLSERFYALARHVLGGGRDTFTGDRALLMSIYRFAQEGLRAAELPLDDLSPLQTSAYGKLRAHLLMLVGLAYSDVREEAMEQARNELEHIIEERTAALTKEEKLAASIIEALPGVFYLFDEHGRFIRWNRNFEIVSQRSANEIACMHPLDFFDAEGQRIIAERIGQVFDTGQSTAEAFFVAKDGTRRPYFFTGRRVYLGERVCLIGVAMDVTERKHAEGELQRAHTAQLFGALLESAPDAMVVSDRTAAIVFVNSATQRLFGYPREELLGRSIALLIPDELHERPRPLGTPPLTATVEAEARRRDGSRFPVEITLSPLSSADGVLLTSAIRDITERKRAEAKIRHLNIDLEHRVAARTRELARSNADLEQFAYVASHDLQEPLRAVASYTQFLVRRYGDRLDGDALRFIDRTVAAVGRMQALIRDLLAYSRVGTRAEPFSPTNCETVLRDVIDDLQATLSETDAVVTHDPLPVVPGDRSQLHQLLQNLIGNAMKFRGGDRPQVHVSARRNGDSWLFTVADNGIGIEAEYAERVFVIFQRLHSRRQYPGTGVGLAICKRIVERHGGRIWVESAVAHGTCMCFELPAERREELPATAVNE